MTSLQHEELEYRVQMVQRKDRFFMRIAELSLVGVGNTVPEAYEDLMRKKESLTTDHVASGLEDELPRPIPGRDPGLSALAVFGGKALIVAAVIGLALFGVNHTITRTATTAYGYLYNVPLPTAGAILRRFEQGLAAMADVVEQLPVARRERMVRDAARVVSGVKPVLDELSPLLAASPDGDTGGGEK